VSASADSPPLRPTGIILRRDMTFWHEGVKVTHPKLYAAFLRGVDFAEEEGVFVVRVGHFRGQIEVEDTPYWVVAYDPGSGTIELTDRTEEPLRVETLSVDPDEVFRCTVKSRFPARFTRQGQAHLLDNLEVRGDETVVRCGDAWTPAPGIPSGLEDA
jgi:hypothetical protein